MRIKAYDFNFVVSARGFGASPQEAFEDAVKSVSAPGKVMDAIPEDADVDYVITHMETPVVLGDEIDGIQ